jgi:uncharacterized protein DUF6187
MSEPYDTVFALPAVDADPETEIGVLLMGFEPERLLAGLGVAGSGLAAEPASATTYVDQLRHGARDDVTLADALAAGARRWRAAGAGLDAVLVRNGTQTAALRDLWADAAAGVVAAGDIAPGLRTASDAERVYLIACWLRRAEITRTAEEQCPI